MLPIDDKIETIIKERISEFYSSAKRLPSLAELADLTGYSETDIEQFLESVKSKSGQTSKMRHPIDHHGRIVPVSETKLHSETNVNVLGLKRTETFQDGQSEDLTDIVFDCSTETFILVREMSACVTTRTGDILSVVNFTDRLTHPRVVVASEMLGFLSRGSWLEPAALFDRAGTRLWSIEPVHGINDTTFGDIDKDGKIEFIVGFNGDGGIALFEQDGKQRWHVPNEHVSHVAITGDGQIVQTGVDGFRVRDCLGQVIKDVRTPFNFKHFSVVHWPNQHAEEYLLACDIGQATLFDLDGTIAQTFEIPRHFRLIHASATCIRLTRNEPDHFALLAFDPYGRATESLLRIYDSKTNLVFSEVLASHCHAMTVETSNTEAIDSLIIGSKLGFWKYQLL